MSISIIFIFCCVLLGLVACIAILIVVLVAGNKKQNNVSQSNVSQNDVFQNMNTKEQTFADGAVKYCSQCGTPLPADSAFCSKCGSAQAE